MYLVWQVETAYRGRFKVHSKLHRARDLACHLLLGLAELLETHGLDAWQHDWLDVLSGGEKQRVGLAGC